MAVGTLGVLAVLGVAFVAMAQLERKASSQRLQACRAALLARSGLDDALARLAAGQDPEAAWNRYGGENWDGDAGNRLSSREAASQAFRPTRTGSAADTDDCPASCAMRPSFFVRTGGVPSLLPVDGRERGFSGALQATPLNHHVLRLTPRYQTFHVNGGDPGAPPAAGYNAVLRRMLGMLTLELFSSSPLGNKLIDLRPSGGWISFEQIRDVALGGDAATLATLRPYLTLDAGVDLHAVVTNASADLVNTPLRCWGDLRTGRALDLERSSGRVVGRSPVDWRWARRNRPALRALLANLEGLYLDESDASPWGAQNRIGILRRARITDSGIATDDCHRVMDFLLASTSEVRTWQDWNALCDALPVSGTSDLAQARRDVLKANFNPESDLNKFNPNPSLWKSVDKSDLLATSTELGLDAPLAWRVESLGRVLAGDGRLLASATVTAEIPRPLLARLTTQREFVCENLGDLQTPGDESGVRLPGSPRFLSGNQGAGKTWGHTLPALAPGGAALQSYPRPCYDTSGLSTDLAMAPADYDGNLQLATVETASGATYGVATPTRVMKCLARFDDGFDLDLADSANPLGKGCLPDTLMVCTTELGADLLQTARPNTLYPDGAYCEAGRTPSFLDRFRDSPSAPAFPGGPGFHGVLSFWVKPNYRALLPDLSRVYVSRSNVTDPLASGATTVNQCFFVADARYTGRTGMSGLTGQVENGHNASDYSTNEKLVEHQVFTPFGVDATPAPHRWSLATVFWDFKAPAAANTYESLRLVLNDGVWPQGSLIGMDSYGDTNAYGLADDITLDDFHGPHRLALGPLAHRDMDVRADIALGADATLDEFAVYDFGGARGGGRVPAATLASPSVLALARFREGRYYKGDAYAPAWAAPVADQAGSYLSPPIILPPGSRLERIAWTWHRPDALPDDYAEVELLTADAAAYLVQGSAALSRSSQEPGWSSALQAWPVRFTPSGPFRIRVLFRRATPLGADTPILDSPVLDDLTIAYAPEGARPSSFSTR